MHLPCRQGRYRVFFAERLATLQRKKQNKECRRKRREIVCTISIQFSMIIPCVQWVSPEYHFVFCACYKTGQKTATILPQIRDSDQ